ncbi:MAG TPA: Gfo/Idh/MocA family oxidoreductase [Gemmatimonadales bacterium]|nr:Gfo/Idh/MocA family oxidoreductase [Gemmatimonadales bacterium]
MTAPRIIPKDVPLRLVFLGCGNIARRHAQLIRKRFRDVHLFFASRDGTRAGQFSRELGGAGSFAGYASALADPSTHVAFVATPTAQHLELTLAALAAGKDVIVEKPPFMQSSDFDQVEAAMAASGRRVFVAENYYYRPLTRTLRKLISEGAVGDVRYLIVKALKQQKTGGWRDDVKIAGGGALFEGGIHWVDLMASIGLSVKSVSGWAPRNAQPERSMLVVFKYEEGPVGTLFHSWDTPSLLKGLRLSRIHGSGGSIAFESNGLFLLLFSRRPRIIFPGFRDISGYGAMLADFLGAIRNGREPEFSLAMARRDLQLVEEAYRTAAES